MYTYSTTWAERVNTASERVDVLLKLILYLLSRGEYHPGTPSTKRLDVGIQVTTNSA